MSHEASPDQKDNIELSKRQESRSVPKEGRVILENSESSSPNKALFESEKAPTILDSIIDIDSSISARTYTDEHGLPVTYNATTHQKQTKNTMPDDISILWHELLSPLTVIKGYTSTLIQLNKDITEEQRIQYVQGIESASNRMIRLLENFRDVTKLEGNIFLATQRISVVELLRSIMSEVQNQTTKHFIKLRPSERLPLINVDPEKIGQIVSNLLVNAIKYSPHGGDIEAEVRMVQSEQELRRMFGDTPKMKLPCIIISISDAGIGIPENDIERIFERFHRVKNKLTQATQGIGLGLYICKMLVQAHGGRIWARNKLQGGSIFSFSIPVNS